MERDLRTLSVIYKLEVVSVTHLSGEEKVTRTDITEKRKERDREVMERRKNERQQRQ